MTNNPFSRSSKHTDVANVNLFMVALALAGTLLALQAKPSLVTPKVVSVSMFKNGFAFVTREVPLNEGSANVIEIPQSSLGSLWFWTDTGTIDTITSVDETDSSTTEIPLSSWDEVFKANIGRSFNITVERVVSKDGKEAPIATTYEGILKMFEGQMVGLELADGIEFLDRRAISKVRVLDKGAVYTQKKVSTKPIRYYQVKTTGGSKRLVMLSLERGMTWAPGYAIDISNERKLNFTAKATLLNDLLDIDSARVRLITGFPNLRFKNILDPLTSRMSVDDWLAAISPRGFDGFGAPGGGGRAGEMRAAKAATAPSGIDHLTYDPTDNPLIVNDASGEQLDDLFLYDLEKVTLRKGARSYQYLYQFESDYRRIYTWNGESDGSVNHVIKFKNPTSKPITTAAATIFKKGEITGQGMMTYTPGNTESELIIGRSLDFKTEVDSDIIDRQNGAIKDKKGNPIVDLVTYEVTLEISNPKPTPAEFNVIRQLSGKLVASEPKAVADTKVTGVKSSNPLRKLEWTISVPPGESKTLKFTYKAYVPAGR